jgi:oxygen-independent coproporphyrinogen-3 oxidase
MLSDAELKHLTEKYDMGNVPGYLSYPVMSHWKQAIQQEDVLSVFEREGTSTKGDAYIYFHSPFCQTLCYYCACFMQVTLDPKRRHDGYIDAVERELDLKFNRLGGRRLRTGEMHWGGGTPTYMDCEQIERVFRLIDRRLEWSASPTISIEAYPDEAMLTDEKLHLLASLGFTQISFGIESFDPTVLTAINRHHELTTVRRVVDKSRALGLGVHVDLVYGLPYETIGSMRETVDAILSVKPDRLATFSFMYNPLEIHHQRVIPRSSVPGSRERVRLYETLDSMVTDAGYTRIGSDHYVLGSKDPLAIAARKGEIIYHYQGYEPMSRKTFLGFGSASVTFAQDQYFQNQTNVTHYMSELAVDRLPVATDASALLSRDDKIRHRVIMKSILCDLAINKANLQREFEIDFDHYFADELSDLRELQTDGLIDGVDNQVINVTHLGMPFIRNICHVFDKYYKGHSWTARADAQ